MASNEVKVSTMTFLADVPDDAKIYVVKPGVTTPYYTTKAALLASISGGTTPNFQAVTDGLGNNETTNPVKFIIDSDNYIEIDTANKTIRFYKDGDAVVNINENGISLSDNDPINIKSIDLNPSQIQGTTPGTSYSLIDGTLQLETPLGTLVIHPEKITINGIDYHLPTGASSQIATLADITASTPDLPTVLAQGDRPIRYSDGDGDTILELADREKFLYNRDADFLHLPADLYPVNTVLKIHNIGTTELYCIPDLDNNPSISINGGNIDEFTPIVLQPGTAVLKKVNGGSFSETWILTYEVLDFSREALGLNLVDNTPDNSKPVSTAQATAIANAQSAAQTYAKNYTDNIRLKTPARIAIDTNVSLTGALTVGSITLITGDVVLCLAQTDALQNGLWIVNQTGAWTRTEDFRTGLDVSFCWFPVLGGNYAGRFFGTGAGRIVGTNNISLQDNTFLALLTGISFADGTDITAANNVLQALGKLQKQLTDVRAAKQDKEIWLSNISSYTLASTTVLQKAFNIGTNGALNAETRIYQFEGLISLSSLSSTSGSISFGFLGTATISSIRYTHISMKGTLVSTPFSSIITTANQTVLTNSNTNTAGYMKVSGIIRISGAGSLIPAVGMSVASAAVVDANSYFKFIELGLNTDTNSSSGTS